MKHRVLIPALSALALASLAACTDVTQTQETPDILGKDPLLSRALNDPLMVDPDLSWRSEANAVIGYRDGHPLPPFDASDAAANRAREAARVQLLENGPIPTLPAAGGSEGVSLATLSTADQMVEALGSRTDCIATMSESLRWADGLPPTSSIMPHGMAQQAAGVDQGTCVIRVVRYLTPVSEEDALEYHFAKADRARFRIERFATPEAQLRAERRDQIFTINTRKGPGGMTAVDVVHWRK